MTRSFIRNMSEWLRTAFWHKVFAPKAQQYSRKVKTPRDYYRSKARQQARSASTVPSPETRKEYYKAEMARATKRKR